MNDNFKIVNEFLGFGEPSGKIWFIGIEEGGVWSEDPVNFQKEIKSYKDSGGFKYNAGNDSLKTPVYVIISKIISGLTGYDIHWKDFRELCLFRMGTDVFQMNLFPLGKKNEDDWPEHYKALFSYGEEDYERYISDVRKIRFPLLEKFWNKHSPEITICFGSEHRAEFKKLFKLNGQAETYEDGPIEVYKEKKIILTPFFRNNNMSDKRIHALVNILKNMNVQPTIKI